ncbi:MAG: hypothetical protein U0174_16290 [Polyangiaceae bacterium]
MNVPFRFVCFVALLALPTTAACGGSGVTIGEFDASSPSDGGTPQSTDGATNPDGAASGPKVSIYVRATAATFPHQDGLASLQPKDERLWIKSLAFDYANGPSNLKVFELTDAKETPINDKDETLVAEVPISTLTNGTAIKAHVAVTTVAYRVPTKLHWNNMTVDGEILGHQAMSNGAVLGGSPRNSGYYTVDFLFGGNKVAGTSGESAPLPTGPVGGGFELSLDQGVAYYSFPLSLPISNSVKSDLKMYMTLNVDHNFRWVDSKKADYVAGAWDTEPPTFEEVVRFGANSFALSLE